MSGEYTHLVAISAAEGAGLQEIFHVEYEMYMELVSLDKAKKFIIEKWRKFGVNKKDCWFKVISTKYYLFRFSPLFLDFPFLWGCW